MFLGFSVTRSHVAKTFVHPWCTCGECVAMKSYRWGCWARAAAFAKLTMLGLGCEVSLTSSGVDIVPSWWSYFGKF